MFSMFGLWEHLSNHFLFLGFISTKKASVVKFSVETIFQGMSCLTNNIITPPLAFRFTSDGKL